MNDRPKADVIEKIRKILSKTEEAGCTTEESQAAFQMASRIMAEHNLDMAEIESGEGGEQSWLEDDVLETGRWSLEQNCAYGIASEFFFVKGIFGYKHSSARQRRVLRFFGRPNNVASAKWVFGALLDAFDRLFAEYRRQHGAPASDRRLFVTGVAGGFREKMKDERRAVEVERDLVQGKTSGSTALALRSVMDETTEEFERTHKTKTARSNFATVSGSQSAFDAGHNAGRKLELRRAIGDSGRKGITGQS